MEEKQKPQKLFYRVSVIAEMLDVSRSKAYQLIASNELEAVHIGASLRVSADALARFVAQKSAQGLA